MFCMECGSELINGAKFCPKCGTLIGEINSANSTLVSDNSVYPNNSYNNDALRIYLCELLRLEYALHKLRRVYNEKKRVIEKEKNFNYVRSYQLGVFDLGDGYRREAFNVYLKYDGKRYLLNFEEDDYNNWCVCTRIYNDNDLLSRYNKFLPFEDVEPENFYWDFRTYLSTRQRNKFTKIFASEFMDKVEQFKREAPLKYRENIKILNSKIVSLNANVDEQRKVHALLKKAYDINIIPQQFRNLYAIYYLSEFMNTSNESLSTALLHFDLNVIKQKLDRIIENQEKMILELAYIESQNKEIIEHNKSTLNYLASIESNSQISAQYSQISASYAEATAWFSLVQILQNEEK